MPELEGGIEADYRQQWIAAGRPLPLEVCRSGYDEDIVSWEVLWWEMPLMPGRGGCQSPIAEFTTWAEAQAWAQREATTGYHIGGDWRQEQGPEPMPWTWCEGGVPEIPLRGGNPRCVWCGTTSPLAFVAGPHVHPQRMREHEEFLARWPK